MCFIGFPNTDAKDKDWVVAPEGGANVRKEKDLASEMLATKKNGTIVTGKREGDWVALTDEPGYMMLRNGSTILLQPKDTPEM